MSHLCLWTFSKEEQKQEGTFVKRKKLENPLTWAGTKCRDNTNAISTCDTQTGSEVSGIQKIIPVNGGVS